MLITSATLLRPPSLSRNRILPRSQETSSVYAKCWRTYGGSSRASDTNDHAAYARSDYFCYRLRATWMPRILAPSFVLMASVAGSLMRHWPVAITAFSELTVTSASPSTT